MRAPRGARNNRSEARNTTLNYNAGGTLISANIQDDKPRTVNYTNDTAGQTVARKVSYGTNAAPREVYYRFGGKEMGTIGNNGTDNVDYKTSSERRTANSSRGVFANGSNYGSDNADFDQNYQAINSFNQGSAAGTYTVRGGESLQSIAQQVYGDSSLR